MEKKKYLFIFGIFLTSLVAMLLLIFFYNYLNSRTKTLKPVLTDIISNKNEPAQTNTGEILPYPTRTRSDNQSVREFGQKDLEKMASSFAERFGSFSNHSSFNNVSDLKVFMTESMKQWADEFIKEKQKNQDYKAAYFGITTTAALEKTIEYDSENGKAKILVTTQRRESEGDVSNSSTYEQDILISFEKVSGVWKVSAAEWQDKI